MDNCCSKSRKTHHTKDECDAFCRNESLSSLDKLPTVMQILLPLRIWLLQKGDEALWNRVLSMEAHVDERRDTPIWKNREVNVIEVNIKKFSFQLINKFIYLEVIQAKLNYRNDSHII